MRATVWLSLPACIGFSMNIQTAGAEQGLLSRLKLHWYTVQFFKCEFFTADSHCMLKLLIMYSQILRFVHTTQNNWLIWPSMMRVLTLYVKYMYSLFCLLQSSSSVWKALFFLITLIFLSECMGLAATPWEIHTQLGYKSCVLPSLTITFQFLPVIVR